MADRVDATITIGGPVPADRVEDLLDVIEAEGLGPDWEAWFSSRADLLAFLKESAAGAVLYAREVAGGEFAALQAFCVEAGLTYVLTYDGYGGQWGPARRIRRPGDEGDGVTCWLDADGGNACVNAFDIRHLGLCDADAILQHLRDFDDPDIPALEIPLAPEA